MAAETKLVRLKPYNKKKGHVLRRYTYRGIRFQGSRGWYRVTGDVAGYLGKVRQVPDDADSPPAFDVCSEAEAKEIDKLEAHHARGALPAEEATDVTLGEPEPEDVTDSSEAGGGDLSTTDLPQGKRKRAKK